jgi:hypothetical protein
MLPHLSALDFYCDLMKGGHRRRSGAELEMTCQ